MKVAQKDIELLAKEINEIKGIANPSRRTVGSYVVSYAYGGCELQRVVNPGGAVTDVSRNGHGTKKELYMFMQGFILGLSND